MPTRINDLGELSAKALLCRTAGIRHGWEPANPAKIVTNSRGLVTMYTEVIVCSRCGARKEYEKDKASGWRYVKCKTIYPDGYLVAPELGRLNITDVETERVGRMLRDTGYTLDEPKRVTKRVAAARSTTNGKQAKSRGRKNG